jgi:hypothetical protein
MRNLIQRFELTTRSLGIHDPSTAEAPVRMIILNREFRE